MMSDESLNSEAVEPAPVLEATAASEPVDNGEPGEVEPPKTFTQAELDKIVGEAKAKTERRVKREWEQAQVAESQRPSPTAPPQPEHYADENAYIEAVIDHRAELKLAQRDDHQRRLETNSTYADREETARDKYDDFQQVVHRNPADGGPSITEYMADVIKGSEMGPEIAYHLGKNTAESRRICRLTPLQQAMEIGKIEARLNTSPPVKKASSAPEPITPVGSRSHTPTYDVSDPRSSKSMSDSEWIAARNKQIMKRAQG